MSDRFSLLLLIVIFAVPSCRQEESDKVETGEVIAKVGDELITAEAFRAEMSRRRVSNKAKAKRALLDEMIEHRKMVAAAKGRGLEKDPEMVRQIENLLVSRLQKEMLDESASRGFPTEKEIQEYYNANPDEFRRPRRVRVAKIFVEAPSHFRKEKRFAQREKIEKAHAAASSLERNTEHFGAFAVEWSEDNDTRYRGGVLDYIVEGFSGHGGDVEKVAFGLKEPGELSEIWESEEGYFFFKLIDSDAGSLRPFNEVSAQILSKLVARSRNDFEESVRRKATAGIMVEVDEDALERTKLEEVPVFENNRLPSFPAAE